LTKFVGQKSDKKSNNMAKSKSTEKAVSKKPRAYKTLDDEPSTAEMVNDIIYQPSYIINTSLSGVGSLRFFNLADYTGLNREWLATAFLGLSLKTLQRYAQEDKSLTPREGEAILKLEALYKKGIEIFGNRDEFNSWLKEPEYGLGWQVPLELLSTSTGIDMIMEELLRIEFGATA
jgi:putative toxin-antitoxin system antitoxin component (TIGR02293 family)